MIANRWAFWRRKKNRIYTLKELQSKKFLIQFFSFNNFFISNEKEKVTSIFLPSNHEWVRFIRFWCLNVFVFILVCCDATSFEYGWKLVTIIDWLYQNNTTIDIFTFSTIHIYILPYHWRRKKNAIQMWNICEVNDTEFSLQSNHFGFLIYCLLLHDLSLC